ncbi:MAG: homocysteine methyltransferase [Phycisphaerae bacterium]|nr:homocysteine methyltransferase [Phycisphaerae bacterium]
MTRINLSERVKSGVFFFIDGAMGTQLMAEGIKVGSCFDAVNLQSPQIVERIHRRYFEAGCDAVLTNTFGANAVTLARHALADQAAEINRTAAQIARTAAGTNRYVLGDIGPSGDFLEPVGSLKPDILRAAFVEQTQGLVSGGVDGIIIETMTALDEMLLAIEAVQSVCRLPILCSFAYDPSPEGFRTMMGVTPETIVAKMSGSGISALGFNCGTLSMEGYVALTERLAGLLKRTGIALLAEPNAGRPELIDGKATYRLTPEEYASAVVDIYKAGASILGGCCGTSPRHIAAMVSAIRGLR